MAAVRRLAGTSNFVIQRRICFMMFDQYDGPLATNSEQQYACLVCDIILIYANALTGIRLYVIQFLSINKAHKEIYFIYILVPLNFIFTCDSSFTFLFASQHIGGGS